MTGKQLKQRREKLKLSQRALAMKFGATQNTISRWEMETIKIQNQGMLDLALKYLESKINLKK